jgi:hypothetical protein
MIDDDRHRFLPLFAKCQGVRNQDEPAMIHISERNKMQIIIDVHMQMRKFELENPNFFVCLLYDHDKSWAYKVFPILTAMLQ